jgi:hypothetical protein
MQLVIDSRGRIRCVYAETVELSRFGRLNIERGSHVEADAHGYWWADLAPVNGPRLGPFGLRSNALHAEQKWLHSHWLTQSAS